MSKARKLVRKYLDEMKATGRATTARRTVFTRQAGGVVLRRVVRADGTVEHQTRIPAEQWEIIAARAGTGLSQEQFARLLGVSRRTLQEWEQGRKRPSGAARVLLKIAAHQPNVLLKYAA
jgi:putative transcriptional regulator